jgi:phytanoyl-CoA hydroxylase
MILTPQQIRQFEEDGLIILERILTDEQVERARVAMDRIFRGEVPCDRRPAELRKPVRSYQSGSQEVRHLVHGRLLDDDLWEIMTDAQIGEMAAALLGASRVSLVEDQLFEKPPGSAPIAMHQDYSYMLYSRSPRITTCWIALTETTVDTAPLEYVRGSHRWPLGAVATRFSDGSEADYMEVVEAVRPPGAPIDLVSVVVPAGGGAFHNLMTMHGSRRNTSSRPRRAITMCHAAEECRADFRHLAWHPSMWEGIVDGDRITNRYMPVVYPGTHEVGV